VIQAPFDDWLQLSGDEAFDHAFVYLEGGSEPMLQRVKTFLDAIGPRNVTFVYRDYLIPDKQSMLRRSGFGGAPNVIICRDEDGIRTMTRILNAALEGCVLTE